MATKKRIGRPATGHDPTLTIRVRQEWKDWVSDFHQYAQSAGSDLADELTESDIWRGAIALGMQSIQEGKWDAGYIPYGVRPRHFAEIHEAGHVVMAFLAAQDEGLHPASVIREVKLKPKGGGHVVPWRYLNHENELRICVAGCAAEAWDQGRTFSELWAEYQPKGRGDHKNAAQLVRQHGLDFDAAVHSVHQAISQRDIWKGLVAVARALKIHETVDGEYCWAVYSAELARSLRYSKRRGRKGPINWRVDRED
jgi:hypothetical protein